MINWFLTTRDLNSMLTSTTRDTLCGIFFFLEHWQNNETPRHMKCVRKKTQNQILDHSALWLTELTTRIARACCTWWSKCLLRRRADVFGSKDLTSKKSRPTNMSLECGGGGDSCKKCHIFLPRKQYSIFELCGLPWAASFHFKTEWTKIQFVLETESAQFAFCAYDAHLDTDSICQYFWQIKS